MVYNFRLDHNTSVVSRTEINKSEKNSNHLKRLIMATITALALNFIYLKMSMLLFWII